MTIQNKFLNTLAIGRVLISSASGLMVVNAQTASSATTDSISMAAKKGQKSRKNGLGATIQTAQESRNKVIADLGLSELMYTNKGKAGKTGMMKNQNYQNTPDTNK